MRFLNCLRSKQSFVYAFVKTNAFSGFIIGTVYDSNDYAPLSAVSITDEGSSITVLSLPGGRFMMQVPAGTSTLNLTKTGYQDEDVLNIEVIEGLAAEVNIMMDPVGTQAESIELAIGWNLISLPKQLSDTSIENVLSSIVDKYESVWAYVNGQWKSFDPVQPFFSDLTGMQAGIGYWIKMKEAAELTVIGSDPSGSISLADGWNLVGYNGSEVADIETALASIAGNFISVWAYINGQWKSFDPAQPFFSDLNNMTPGVGYWIKTSEASTWSLL